MTLQLDYPSENEIKQRVIAAVCRLYRHDWDLLDVEINERAITHKLAEYFQDEFPEWHVDCEYNRLGNQVKRVHIENQPGNLADMDQQAVIPDIIVHRRRTGNNLLAIEVKKSGGSEELDYQKLRAFTIHPSYKYHFGLFLRIGLGNVELTVFSRGREISSWTVDLQEALRVLGYGE
ncbi:hypothetical protein [Bellilinea sp.]|uniref:hypothetical protein n=1 Tax=Bellilinea sp. TaxID=2838785 RepID=UPI002ADD8090|nr:hypothetical protein [Bellilinea sp.]